MRLGQSLKFVPVLEAEDHAAGADVDSINIGKGQHLTLVFLFGELTGDAVLTINSGATAGTKTTAETFHYAATAADLKAASGDVLGAYSTSAALTLTAATYEDRMLVVEIDHDDITDGQPWITPNISSAASEEFAACLGILVPRHAKDQSATVIA